MQESYRRPQTPWYTLLSLLDVLTLTFRSERMIGRRFSPGQVFSWLYGLSSAVSECPELYPLLKERHRIVRA